MLLMEYEQLVSLLVEEASHLQLNLFMAMLTNSKGEILFDLFFFHKEDNSNQLKTCKEFCVDLTTPFLGLMLEVFVVIVCDV